VLVAEYEGAVNSPEAAHAAVTSMGSADIALLAGHGVFILGGSPRAVHQRAVALEQRCQHAWMIRAAGGTLDTPLPAAYRERMSAGDGEGFHGFWEAMVRQELRADPTLLENR
jgi:L-ribulose-5-phosphate 4-epimerase